MPRLQVKDQLTKLIWQMSNEIATMTGVQIHIQVYLLTDFWDALKDAHPVIFTFLRDGLPFYDRGIYTSWKELLKLGKIKPSQEAIDMHMNVGTQLVEVAKKSFSDLITNNIYWAVLNPSQAILMLKGYNPTTPKETIQMFEDVLLKKEKIITKRDLNILSDIVKMYKGIEHDKNMIVKGSDVDKMLVDTEYYLEKIKKIFDEITKTKTTESFMILYSDLINELKKIENLNSNNDEKLLNEFSTKFIKTSKVPGFIINSIKSIKKAKKDYDLKKISITEINKVVKEIKVFLTELKTLQNDELKVLTNNLKKLNFLDENSNVYELFNYEEKTYIFSLNKNQIYKMTKNSLIREKKALTEFSNLEKFSHIELTEELFNIIKKGLGIKSIKI